MKKRRFKGIFFDLYGTLLIYNDMNQAWEDWLSAFYNGLCESGLKMSVDEFALKCDGFLTKPEPSIKVENLTSYEKRIYVLGLELGLNLKDEELRRIAMLSINAWEKYVNLDPDAITVLKKLKKRKKLALISNYEHPPHIYSSLTDMKLLDFFDSIVISGEVGVKKPNPQIFNFALEKTNLKPSQVVYIGDTDEDVEAAYNAGVYPVLIKRNELLNTNRITDYYANLSSLRRTESRIDSNITVISNLRELVDFTTSKD